MKHNLLEDGREYFSNDCCYICDDTYTVTAGGGIHFYKNNVFHKDDGPAIYWPNGWCNWRTNGLLGKEVEDGKLIMSRGIGGILFIEREHYESDIGHKD